MKRATGIVILGIVVILLVGIIVFSNSQPKTESQKIDNTNSSGDTNIDFQNISKNSGGITLETLSKHNSQSDCWVGYEGSAYDITSFLPRHPGSAGAIAPYCGTVEGFETAFRNQHGTRKATLFISVAKYKGEII